MWEQNWIENMYSCVTYEKFRKNESWKWELKNAFVENNDFKIWVWNYAMFERSWIYRKSMYNNNNFLPNGYGMRWNEKNIFFVIAESK